MDFESIEFANFSTPAGGLQFYVGVGWLAILGFILWFVKRIHRRLFDVNDRIETIERELALTRSELEYHRSINDDAQRDAAVGNYIDREEAGLTRADVRRFEKTIDSLSRKKADLLTKRDRLLGRLSD